MMNNLLLLSVNLSAQLFSQRNYWLISIIQSSHINSIYTNYFDLLHLHFQHPYLLFNLLLHYLHAQMISNNFQNFPKCHQLLRLKSETISY